MEAAGWVGAWTAKVNWKQMCQSHCRPWVRQGGRSKDRVRAINGIGSHGIGSHGRLSDGTLWERRGIGRLDGDPP